MRAIVPIFVLLLATTPAQAELLPRLHAVQGVASNDVLNVRASPSSSASIVGTLSPFARDVEVVETQGNWHRVNVADTSGWAFGRFLSDQGAAPWHAFDAPLTCFGTEPFWDAKLSPVVQSKLNDFGTVVLLSPMTSSGARPASLKDNRPTVTMSFAAGSGADTLVATVHSGLCSDGMSDRLFGLSATLTHREGANARIIHGCCSIQP